MMEAAYESDDSGLICSVLFFDEAKELVKELLKYDENHICGIEIAEPLYDGYYLEYLISLSSDGDIWVEKSYSENVVEKEDGKGAYLKFDASKVFVDEYANYKILKCANPNSWYQISFSERDDI